MLYGYEIAAAKWDVETGRAEMKRALALNPNSPDALFVYGMFHWVTGNHSAAIAVADHLIQIDPLSPIAARLRAEALVWSGRNAEGRRADSLARKLDPTVLIWEATDGIALREMGQLDSAVAVFQAFEKATGQPSVGLAVTYGRMGRRDDALRVIHAIEARERREWVDPDFIAIAYAGIGDADHTMQWLETAFQKKCWSLRAFANYDIPWFRTVRNDPRFLALKKRVLATTFKT
jgi:tetratricopeptide (TPR) repeat protein